MNTGEPDRLSGLVSALGLDATRAPTLDEWRQVLAAIQSRSHTDASRYEAIFESSPVPIMEQDYTLVIEEFDRLRMSGIADLRGYVGGDIERIRDLAGRIRVTSLNPAAIGTIGLDPSLNGGHLDPAVVNIEAFDAWMDQFETVWEGRTRSEFVFQAATVTGRRFDGQRIMVVPVGPYGPDYSAVVMTINDITPQADERRRIEDLLDKRNEFLGAVSHEIRTPLTGVLGFAELLIDGLDSMPLDDQRDLLQSVIQQAHDVSSIVEDLLVSSRAEAGDLAVTSEPVDLVTEARQVIANGGQHTDGVDLETTLDRALTTGDPGRVRQIIRNLLTNAARYGGDDVRILIGRAGESVALSVIDDGPGIPVDRVDAAFLPYQRTTGVSTESDSAGLGLPICRSLARAMNGDLTYQHSDGYSRFILTVPALDD